MPFGDDEFEFYPDLECDLEDEPDATSDCAPAIASADEPQITMPDLDAAPPAPEQRSARVLGVLERKLAEREQRGAGSRRRGVAPAAADRRAACGRAGRPGRRDLRARARARDPRARCSRSRPRSPVSTSSSGAASR
jgi:hypothetical protein